MRWGLTLMVRCSVPGQACNRLNTEVQQRCSTELLPGPILYTYRRKHMQRAGVQMNLHLKQASRIEIFLFLLGWKKHLICTSSAFAEAGERAVITWLLGNGLLLQAEIKLRNWATFKEHSWKASAESKGSMTPRPAQRLAVQQGAAVGAAHPLCRAAQARCGSTRNEPCPCRGLAAVKLFQQWAQGIESALPGSPLTCFSCSLHQIHTCCWAYRTVKNLLCACCFDKQKAAIRRGSLNKTTSALQLTKVVSESMNCFRSLINLDENNSTQQQDLTRSKACIRGINRRENWNHRGFSFFEATWHWEHQALAQPTALPGVMSTDSTESYLARYQLFITARTMNSSIALLREYIWGLLGGCTRRHQVT